MAEGLSGASAPRFELRGIRKSFGATLALDGVELSVRPGEVVALVGQNGAGKSTLMNILSGALAPDGGEMRLDGAPFRPRSPLEARRAGVAMIYQELSLAPHLSVMENVMLGVEPTRAGVVRWGRVREAAHDALAQLHHLEIPVHAAVGELSVAQQQLVEIARALAASCRILVLDEPTSSLAQQDVHRLFELVGRLKQRGHAIVYISHFLEEVKQVADRYVVLRDGRNAGGGAMAGASLSGIVGLMVGQEVGELYPRSPREAGEPVLELLGFGPGAADLVLRRGEVLGIAGLLGAGRTRLLRGIFGLQAVREGSIRVAGHAGPASPARRWRQGAGFLSEDRKQEGLALELSIAENLTLSRLPRLVRPREQREAAQRFVDALGIRCREPGQEVRELSGGNQQKVAFARLLHHDVDVLLLDEPTRGIDVASKAQLYAMIDRLVAAPDGSGKKKALLLVSSYFPELLGLCDRIAVMCRGRLGLPRPAGEWNEHELVLAAAGAQGAA